MVCQQAKHKESVCIFHEMYYEFSQHKDTALPTSTWISVLRVSHAWTISRLSYLFNGNSSTVEWGNIGCWWNFGHHYFSYWVLSVLNCTFLWLRHDYPPWTIFQYQYELIWKMVSEFAQHSKIPHSTVHGNMIELIIAMQCGPVPIHTRKISIIRRTKS